MSNFHVEGEKVVFNLYDIDVVLAISEAFIMKFA